MKKFNWRHLASFVVALVLSFLFDTLGWLDQSKAYFWIVIVWAILAVVFCFISLIIMGHSTGTLSQSIKKASRLFLTILGAIAILLMATWGASKLFGVDFYVTFLLIGLGVTLSATLTPN